jgi:hypothetical protein
MSYGAEDLFTKLNTDINVVSLIDDFEGDPAIWFAELVPESFVGNKYINFYESTFINNTLNYGDYSYTINCRAGDSKDSKLIRDAVVTSLNRVNASTTRGIFYTSIIPTIPPKDANDLYNSIVECRIKNND